MHTKRLLIWPTSGLMGPLFQQVLIGRFFVVVASSQTSNKLVEEIKISISFPHTESCCTNCPEYLILPFPFFHLAQKTIIIFKYMGGKSESSS